MAELTSLGKYEIRRELGRGAMGVVYEGYDPMIKRTVALKTIRADQLAGEESETAIARFRREAQAAGRLSHPNIVSIYDFGEDAGVWFIAMEFVEGRSLRDYFQANERFAPPDIVRIMGQILDALGYSHRMGVVHRDIKPANVILLADGRVKIADFGIAHIESSSMTQAGTALGTPSYMSPEQIMGLPVDGRSDLFSAGVILYQFLTGERPFSGSTTATMHKVLEEDPLPPSRFNVQVPGEMDAVVRKALAKRPDERYQTADELAAAIRAAAQREATTAAEPTLIAPAVAAPAVSATARGERTAVSPPALSAVATPEAMGAGVAAAPPARKSPVALVATVAGIALVAIVAAVWMMMHRGSGDAGIAQAPAAPSPTTASAPPKAGPPAAAPAAQARAEPGTMVISAVGLIDPKDPRYATDKALLQSDLRADAKGQLIQKALRLMLDPKALAMNYGVLKDKLLAQSANYVSVVVKETPPQLGKDGLMSMTTEAVVNVKALQKSLNQMSRDERIEFIRAGGDPRVAVRIAVRDADQPGAPAQPSPVAENVLKERIKAFGFRTWSDGGEPSAEGKKGPNFEVQGEAEIKRLSARLAASGLVITKYTLASWTVKCIDRETGEEIYFNTTLPKAAGSWASEAEALKAIGTRVADEFSRNFFLQHFTLSGRKVTLTVDGMPAPAPDDPLERELIGLPAVLAVSTRAPAKPRVYDLQLAGAGPEGDLVATGVLAPLNAKLGQACFSLGLVAGDEVTVVLDRACTAATVVARLETYPPAGLYGAPPARQKDVIRDAETLRKLAI